MKKTRNKNIFVDANVVIDYLLARKHHTKNARLFFEQAQNFSAILHVCSYSFAIAYHYMRKEKNIPHHFALGALKKMSHNVKSLPVNETIIKQAMSSEFRDFEDAIQYFCALQVPKCEAIITRNPNDFALSNVFVSSPQKFSFQ